MELRFIGFDDKKRKVYIDNSGKFWKPLTIEHKKAHALFRSENNEFNGEPFGNALPTGDERLVQIVDRFSSYDNKERNKEICEKIEKLVSDVDPINGVVKVINGKNGVSRYIPVSDSLKMVLSSYAETIDMSDEDKPFFISSYSGADCTK